MAGVENPADDRALVFELLEAFDLHDELDRVVAGVRKRRVALTLGPGAENPPPAVEREQLFDGDGLVVPDPVAMHRVLPCHVAPFAQFDVYHAVSPIVTQLAVRAKRYQKAPGKVFRYISCRQTAPGAGCMWWLSTRCWRSATTCPRS